jgi:tetratricopeptide (TPR) repeat protein
VINHAPFPSDAAARSVRRAAGVSALFALCAAVLVGLAPAGAQQGDLLGDFGSRPADPDAPGIARGELPDLDGAVLQPNADQGEAADEAEPEPPLTRAERFDKLFAELGEAKNDEDAAFIAEEIEALWRDSGSATVDLLTDRATDALAMGETELARELIDGALELDPDHAEAWAQSAMIAMAEDEVGLALENIEKAVSLEPRHYDALTDLGLVLERLDQPAGAYDAYEKALDLNPRLPAAVAGAERTRRDAEGREL